MANTSVFKRTKQLQLVVPFNKIQKIIVLVKMTDMERLASNIQFP